MAIEFDYKSIRVEFGFTSFEIALLLRPVELITDNKKKGRVLTF